MRNKTLLLLGAILVFAMTGGAWAQETTQTHIPAMVNTPNQFSSYLLAVNSEYTDAPVVFVVYDADGKQVGRHATTLNGWGQKIISLDESVFGASVANAPMFSVEIEKPGNKVCVSGLVVVTAGMNSNDFVLVPEQEGNQPNVPLSTMTAMNVSYYENYVVLKNEEATDIKVTLSSTDLNENQVHAQEVSVKAHGLYVSETGKWNRKHSGAAWVTALSSGRVGLQTFLRNTDAGRNNWNARVASIQGSKLSYLPFMLDAEGKWQGYVCVYNRGTETANAKMALWNFTGGDLGLGKEFTLAGGKRKMIPLRSLMREKKLNITEPFSARLESDQALDCFSVYIGEETGTRSDVLFMGAISAEGTNLLMPLVANSQDIETYLVIRNTSAGEGEVDLSVFEDGKIKGGGLCQLKAGETKLQPVSKWIYGYEGAGWLKLDARAGKIVGQVLYMNNNRGSVACLGLIPLK